MTSNLNLNLVLFFHKNLTIYLTSRYWKWFEIIMKNHDKL